MKRLSEDTYDEMWRKKEEIDKRFIRELVITIGVFTAFVILLLTGSLI